MTSNRRKPRVGIFDHTGKSLGGAQMVVAHLAAIVSRFCLVELISDHRDFSLDKMAAAFDLELSGVAERIVPGISDSGFEIPGKDSVFEQLTKSRTLADSYDLFIYSGAGVPPFCRGKQGIVYCHFPRHPAPRIGLAEGARWARRNRLDRGLRGAAYDLLWRIRMRPYKAVLANSCFTAGWIERYWGVSAEVVYPPVEMTVPESRKRNVIASVGRFDGCFRRGKEQLAQVRGFRRFLDKVHDGWSLCLIGSCYTPEEKTYLATVKQEAEGLPVTFVINGDRDAVCRALGESKLFWHTQGLSSDDARYPWEAEHFGIATVEAMRAASVPIVIASGGQKEIIQDGLSGFLCTNLDELVQNAVKLANDDGSLCRMSEQARLRSLVFNRDAFEQRVIAIISRYLPLDEGSRGQFTTPNARLGAL